MATSFQMRADIPRNGNRAIGSNKTVHGIATQPGLNLVALAVAIGMAAAGPLKARGQESGACCRLDGSPCEITVEEDCSGPCDTYYGDGTTCNSVVCPAAQFLRPCCLPDGSCDVMLPCECFDQGGHLGDGAACESMTEECPPFGACCRGDLTCEITIEEDCQVPCDEYLGDGTSCPVACFATEARACCLPDGTCIVVTECYCDSLNGQFQRDATCENADCGACCLPDGFCVMTGEDECLAQCGEFVGVGFGCRRHQQCPVDPTVPCCLPDGTCVDLDACTCELQGGHVNPGARCSDMLVPCPPFGACCHSGGTCFLSVEEDCIGQCEVYLGDGSDCLDCVGQTPGPCCRPDGSCVVMNACVCDAQGGFPRTPGLSCATGVCPVPTELAGNALGTYPFFEYVRAFNENAPISAALDPIRFPSYVGNTCDIYVVAAKTLSQWHSDPTLVDMLGGPQTQTITGSTIQANTFTIALPGQLPSSAGTTELGVGYDVVFDFNQDGLFNGDDIIDGLSDEAGLYAVHDVTQDGPLAVTEIFHDTGIVFGIPAGFTNQVIYYPTNIASLGQLPLIVISHGNGHQYLWYDHLGYFLASYGYIVMSHNNNTGPGIHSASTTTLGHTDAIIEQQATIGGGVLDGHIDSSRIAWVGHSRGGEAITYAYDRMFDGTYMPAHYAIDDLKLLSSMLPTDIEKTVFSNPHDANYHLWTASGDLDVTGDPWNDTAQTFHLHDRATHYRHSTIVQGAGHAYFHNQDSVCCCWCTGPCLLDRPTTHLIQKGMFLPLVKHYVDGNIPAHDFFWRQWESFKPIGAPAPGFCPESGGPAVVVNNTYHNGSATGNFVIDDYQAQPDTGVASSGGTVTFDVTNLTEDRLDDTDIYYAWTVADPMNGMTHASSAGLVDDTRGIVFDWNGTSSFYQVSIVPAQSDFTQYKYLSFRACQGTRHPNTVAVLGDLTFDVVLIDSSAATSSINIGSYGGGIEEPYQRLGEGWGVGWHNEMETIRIRTSDFGRHNNLDLTHIVAVRFEFGSAHGSTEGRLGMDDIELTNDAMP